MFENKKKVCSNCQKTYREGDKYCRYCGAPIGESDFIREEFACVYGPPPIRRIQVCEKCGYSREADKESRCPKCGSNSYREEKR